jgi:hypothetical protein
MTSGTQGVPGEALNTRVFFRLWTAPSFDTDYNPSTTYPSTLGATSGSPDFNLPIAPLPSGSLTDPSGQNLQTTPFFATAGGGSDYDPSFNTSTRNNNIQTIEIPARQARTACGPIMAVISMSITRATIRYTLARTTALWGKLHTITPRSRSPTPPPLPPAIATNLPNAT